MPAVRGRHFGVAISATRRGRVSVVGEGEMALNEQSDGKGRLFDPAFLRGLERWRLVARRPLAGQYRAERRSRRTGASQEFAEHRNYAAGDDPRTLDWSAYARLDRLFVKLFHEEEDMQVIVLVDASGSMRWRSGGERAAGGGRSRFDHARRLAAAFAHVSLTAQHQVSVGFFTGGLGSRLAVTRGRSAFHDVLRFLERPEFDDSATSLDAAVRDTVAVVRRRSLAVVISDFLDPAGYERALKGLLHRRFDVSAILVTDPSEAGSLVRGDVALVDSETGEELRLSASDTAVADFLARQVDYSDRLRAWCRSQSIGFAETSCAESPEETLLALLRSGVLAP